MKTIYPAIFVAVVVVISLFTPSCVSRSQQPVYDGKTLSEWLSDVENEKPNETNAQAREAIRQIGTNALPFLLEEISAPGEIWDRVDGTNIYCKSQEAYKRRFNIGVGFKILGPIAKPAIPALVDLLNQGNNPESAADALTEVDPQIAAIALTHALTNKSTDRRIAAAGSLVFVGTNADIAVSNLIQCLKSQPYEKCVMEATLGEIHSRPDITVPALIEAYSDKDLQVRVESIRALGEFGKAAASAVPALKQMTNDSNQAIRFEAAEALKQIQKASP